MSAISKALSPLPQQFVVTERTVTPNSIGDTVLICAANPLRWALQVSATLLSVPPASVSFVLSMQQQIAAALIGQWFGGNAPPFAYNFRDYGVLVQQAWYGKSFNSTSNTTFDVIEVLIQQ